MGWETPDVNKPIEAEPITGMRVAQATDFQGTWVWDADRACVVWADPQAIHAWNTDRLGALLDARFDENHPLLLVLKALRNRLGVGESVIENLRLVSPHGPQLHATCRMGGHRLADGRLGLRIDIVGPPSPAAAVVAPAPGSGSGGKSGAPLSALIAAIGHPLLILDAQGIVTAANPAACHFFDRDEAALTGVDLASWLSEADGQALSMLINGALPPGQTTPLRGNGSVFAGAPALKTGPVEIVVGAVQLGATRRYFALLQDLGARQETAVKLQNAREDAERRSRQKTAFLAQVSHELRTPMTAVLGFAEMLMKGVNGEPTTTKTQAYARNIFEAGHHALSLIEDLIDLSRIEHGRLALEPADLDVSALVDSCLTMVEPLARRADVRLGRRVQKGLTTLHADHRTVRQIFVNLLTNAIRHTPPGGKVSLLAEAAAEGGVTFQVTDTGRGIAPEIVERLQAAPAGESLLTHCSSEQGSSERESRSLGLGLPLARALAEANQARLTLKSTGESGTCIEVTFSLAG